jgi:hypothetical protein
MMSGRTGTNKVKIALYEMPLPLEGRMMFLKFLHKGGYYLRKIYYLQKDFDAGEFEWLKNDVVDKQGDGLSLEVARSLWDVLTNDGWEFNEDE